MTSERSSAAVSERARAALERYIQTLRKDWRGLLRKHVPQARQTVSKLLDGRVSVTPEKRNGIRGFTIRTWSVRSWSTSGTPRLAFEGNPLLGFPAMLPDELS